MNRLHRLLPQILRKVSQFAVMVFIVWAPLTSVWRNYKLAHNNERLVGLMHGDTWATIYSWNDALLSVRGDGLEESYNHIGMPWAATIGGASTMDPTLFLAHWASQGLPSSSTWVMILVPVLLALVLGKFFCSHLCPARFVFEIGQAIRRGLRRLGVFLPTFRFQTRIGGFVLIGGLVSSMVGGFGLWIFLLPYVSLSAAIFLAITGGSAVVVGAAFLVVALVDLFIAPGAFCHNVCPTGFLLELIGRRPAIRLEKASGSTCPDNCRVCIDVCPFALSPREETHMPACNGCSACAMSCPKSILSRQPAWSARRRALPVIASSIALFVSLLSFDASAHHNKGLPHYGYYENYPQVPTEEYVSIKRGWEIGATVFNFQGLERQNAETPNDVKIYLYLYDLKADEGYVGAVDFTISYDDEVVSAFSREKTDEEAIYSTRETLPASGRYVLKAKPRSHPDTTLTLEFDVDLAADAVNWWLVLLLLLPVALVMAVAVAGRSRVKRHGRPMPERAAAVSRAALFLFSLVTALSSTNAVADPGTPSTTVDPAMDHSAPGSKHGASEHGASEHGAHDHAAMMAKQNANAKANASEGPASAPASMPSSMPSTMNNDAHAAMDHSAHGSKPGAHDHAAMMAKQKASANVNEGPASASSSMPFVDDDAPAMDHSKHGAHDHAAMMAKQNANASEGPASAPASMPSTVDDAHAGMNHDAHAGMNHDAHAGMNHDAHAGHDMQHYTTEDGGQVMVMGGIPKTLFLVGIVLIIILSFIGVELFGARPPSKWRYNLTKNKRVYKIVRSRWFQAVPQLTFVVVFFALVYAGLFGSGSQNIMPVAVWTIWWGGLIFAVALVGPVFCFACPWDGLASLTTRLRAIARVEPLSLGFEFPTWLANLYPAILLFVLLTWLELGLGVTTNPRTTAYMGLGMASFAIVGAFLFDGKRFCHHGCPVGRISGIYANFSPVEIRAKNARVCQSCKTEDCLNGNERGYACPTKISLKVIDDATYCTMCTECFKSCDKQNIAINLRPFGADLDKPRAGRLDEAWLSLSLLALTLFHGLSMTPAWENFSPGGTSLMRWMSVTMGTPKELNFTIGMAVVMAIPVLLYVLACWLGSTWTKGRLSTRELFVQYAYSILPVALFYHLAHNAMHLFMEGGNIVPRLSDPMGTGADYFGTRDMHVSALFSDDTTWILQVSLILVGHIFGIVVAHRIAHRLYSERKDAIKSLVPMLFMMVFLSACGLSLMALDMNMRVGRM